MTFIHFLVTLALTFAPVPVVFSALRLGDYEALSIALWTFVWYFPIQLCKLVLFLVFLPSSHEAAVFVWHERLAEALIGALDLIGIRLILQWLPGNTPDVKLPGVALGWNFGCSLTSRLLPLWLNARGLEYSPEHLQSAVSANLDLLEAMTVVALVWLHGRKSLPASARPFVTTALALLCVFDAVFTSFVRLVLMWNNWVAIFLRALTTGALATATWITYKRYTTAAHERRRQ